MEQNTGKFCYKCGKHIQQEASFCPFCGTAQNNGFENALPTQSPSNGELDRDALKIYLGNVLSLECVKAKYERDISNLHYNIRQHSNNNYSKSYELSEKSYLLENSAHFLYNGRLWIAFHKKGNIYPDRHLDEDAEWKYVDDDNDIAWLKDSRYWWRYDQYGAGILAKWTRRENVKEAFFKAYEEFKAEAPLIYESNVRNNREFINNWQQQIDGMTAELETVKKLLKQAYDINIIPSQFRNNIYALYYLHDFISTSRESLTTALLHLDLDEIKAKLDKIISQQETIIIQNAVMIAQNNKLVEQNQQQLERLSRIESNTSQAAQYAQIAANNAETCAWISMANYIEAHD